MKKVINNKHLYDPTEKTEEMLRNNPELRGAYQELVFRDEVAMEVRRLRKSAGLTQQELAEKIGTTQSVISRLEGRKDTRIPTLDLLFRIANACNKFLEIRFGT